MGYFSLNKKCRTHTSVCATSSEFFPKKALWRLPKMLGFLCLQLWAQVWSTEEEPPFRGSLKLEYLHAPEFLTKTELKFQTHGMFLPKNDLEVASIFKPYWENKERRKDDGRKRERERVGGRESQLRESLSCDLRLKRFVKNGIQGMAYSILQTKKWPL